ncbi:Glutathione S-transferase S1 [Gryganskiella cystojenkinii]|nr:Glutathione S-transferase S1 [Gryganskiella cystojenkinii]
MVHLYFSPTQRESYNAMALKTDSNFNLFYFGLHGKSGTVRPMLVAGGADFKNTIPSYADWGSIYKARAPFGLMPCLLETSADGTKTLSIAESDAIERYLAHKFGFYGQDGYDELVINTFVSSTHALQDKLITHYLIPKDQLAAKAESQNKAVNGPIPVGTVNHWIKHHEQHISENPVAVAAGQKHGNGHYLGDKVSYADFKASYVIDMIRGLEGEDLISESKTPALWKLKQTVESIPAIKTWKATEDYKTFSEANKDFLGYY